MSRYTHVLRGQESEAIAHLPDLSLSSGKQANVAAGTDNKSVNSYEGQPKKLTPQLIPTAYRECDKLASGVNSSSPEPVSVKNRKRREAGSLGTERELLSPAGATKNGEGGIPGFALEPKFAKGKFP